MESYIVKLIFIIYILRTTNGKFKSTKNGEQIVVDVLLIHKLLADVRQVQSRIWYVLNVVLMD